MKEKEHKNYVGVWIALIIAVAIIAGAIILSSNSGNKNTNNLKDSLPLPSASSNIYTEVESGGEILEITRECFWSGTQIRCSGTIKDIETNPHTTDDIYVDLIAFDNTKKCGYCTDKVNLGEFSEGKIKTYTLSCEVGKKTDILASIAVTGGAFRIYNGCE